MRAHALWIPTILSLCSLPAESAPMPQDVPSPPPAAPASRPDAGEDPYLWLEDVDGEKSLAWARERNRASEGELTARQSFAPTRDRIRALLDAKDKIPTVAKHGEAYYDFWQDEAHPRGLVRRTSLEEYRKPAPAWEVVLDLDALALAEQENWVFSGQVWLEPSCERCLVSLSRGGGDAVVVREFDPATKRFVADGFTVPEAKTDAAWKDRDTLFVATDFGPGSLTEAGYARLVKEWKRGTPLSEAKLVYEARTSDVGAGAFRLWDHGVAHDFVTRLIGFFSSERYLRSPEGALTRLEVPEDAEIGIWHGHLLVTLRSDWTVGERTWPQGALLAAPLEGFLAGARVFTLLFEPTPTKSLAGTAELASGLVVNELDDLRSRLTVWRLAKGVWAAEPFGPRDGGTTALWPVDPGASTDAYWLARSDYLAPDSLALGTLGGPPATVLKREPERFAAKGLRAEQRFATSKDGTRVPYTVVAREGLVLDGSHPTVLTGYGGFEISLTPSYASIPGIAWLERGGVYAVANIRGGGEYGPAWHQAALRHHRQRAYDDFIAVAEDLVARKVTSPAHLGIVGGSNGGLLMGVMLTQRPDLFGAIVCHVPLLDMLRYPRLPAGASWMEEYGDPEDPEDRAALAAYSPYQQVRRGVKYPRTLFTSSTRDDRVHPGHARKMVARMLEQGHDVLYYENVEGGHGGAANHEQHAFMEALEYTFLAQELGLE